MLRHVQLMYQSSTGRGRVTWHAGDAIVEDVRGRLGGHYRGYSYNALTSLGRGNIYSSPPVSRLLNSI